MRFVFYTHSLVSDWNHGNAHFLRGVVRELNARGHRAVALEPRDGWSRENLLREAGPAAVDRFHADFPGMVATPYGADFPHEELLEQADVVVVHEWTEPAIVGRIGRARRDGGRFTLLFHDTHHRAISAESEITSLDLGDYDFVLAFGDSLRERYRHQGWGDRAVTWHEAADVALFGPRPAVETVEDIVWIGNWGDGERGAELETFLLDPVRRLGLTGGIHGVRYPPEALAAVRAAGLDFRGWLPNADVPEAFARARATVHVPRRPYVESLPGIPTIRVFEALACGIPLVCAPWNDSEDLFRVGRDFLMARDGVEMASHLSDIINDRGLAESLARSGRETILARHTCGHRVDQLLDLLENRGSATVRRMLAPSEVAQ